MWYDFFFCGLKKKPRLNEQDEMNILMPIKTMKSALVIVVPSFVTGHFSHSETFVLLKLCLNCEMVRRNFWRAGICT